MVSSNGEVMCASEACCEAELRFELQLCAVCRSTAVAVPCFSHLPARCFSRVFQTARAVREPAAAQSRPLCCCSPFPRAGLIITFVMSKARSDQEFKDKMDKALVRCAVLRCAVPCCAHMCSIDALNICLQDPF